MAKVQNTFLKSKMNKDLDARILPNGEYRDAQNAQISKSESANVGNLENILGNASIQSFQSLTGVSKLICIGNLADEVNNTVYLFFTDKDNSRSDYNTNYTPSGEQSNNFIISYNVLSSEAIILVKGNFLNFSTENLITGVNILEDLLFFTDNRNQPRVINVSLANPSGLTNPTYYTNEDQISVAKYNPYRSIELYEQSALATTSSNTYYETTMKDVSSLFLPNGGTALANGTQTAVGFGAGNPLLINSINGQINDTGSPYPNSTVSLQNPNSKELQTTGVTVNTINAAGTELSLTGNIDVSNNQVIVFNANPYFDFEFSGDPDYLESKFARFSYRFKFTDNEYSIFAPFTQHAFIPKQDGYFMYELAPNTPKDDQTETYQSTIVYFVENKVNSIGLRIPLPFFNYTLKNALKIKELEILYKESDSLAVRVIEKIPINDITSSAAIAFVNGNQPGTPGVITAGTAINIDGIQGGIKQGETILGDSIPALTTITDFTPTDASSPISGTIKLSKDIPSPGLTDNTFLTIGDINYFTYNYRSTKPTTTLPESELVRVYDKVPLKALAQEVAGNRVMYGNFVNKLTPPTALDYNVICSAKADFNVNEVTAVYIGPAATYSAGSNINIQITKNLTPPDGLFPDMVISCNDPGVYIPAGTTIVTTNNNGQTVSINATVLNASTTTEIFLSFASGSIPIGATITGAGVPGSTTVVNYNSTNNSVIASAAVSVTASQNLSFLDSGSVNATITLSNDITFPLGTVPSPVALVFTAGGDILNTTSRIEYPSSSVKSNRNYQVGFVLSDRYGRQSSVILSNSKSSITVYNETFEGSTLYAPYVDDTINTISWPGDSLKVLMNQPITGDLYNGDTSSSDYNPLGWYSWKVVVKQTEQDYYNVYLPGIMSSYPSDQTLEIGQTSHTVLINDNINKIPRDLNEVGPDQRQFGSSVQLFGRVENTNADPTTGGGNLNVQYYSGKNSDTVSVISTVYDMFDFDPLNPEAPNFFPQFYSLDSNPLVARITTESLIGQLSTTQYFTESGKALKAQSLYNQQSGGSGGAVITTNDAQPQDFVCITQFTGDLTSIITTGIAAGDLVSSNSLPDKTYVKAVSLITTDYPAATGSNSGLKIELFDKDGNDFYFIPIEGELITITRTVGATVPPGKRTPSIPGIQRLAVYETKPVESLLDIYWETSSSGLISDLNTLILNNQSTPGGVDFFPFATNNFDEGLPAKSNILNNLTTGFELVNSFGSPITLVPANGDTIELLSVTNGYNQVVGGSSAVDGTGQGVVGRYFIFQDSTSAQGGLVGPWQIRTTDSTDNQFTDFPANFYDDIYYMYNADNQDTNPLRDFTFNFRLIVDGVENIITKEVSLNNVQQFYDLITVNNEPGSQVTYGPGGGGIPVVPTAPSTIPVRTRRDQENPIINIKAKNGAHNTSLDNAAIQFIDQPGEGVSTSIYSQTVGSIDGPNAVLTGTDTPVFELSSVVGSTFLEGDIKLTNPNSNLVRAALYFVTIRIQDAGLIAEDVTFEIDMRIRLSGGEYDDDVSISGNVFNAALRVESFNYSWGAYAPSSQSTLSQFSQSTYWSGVPSPFWTVGSWSYLPATLLKIDSSVAGITANEAGYYLYAGGVFNNEYSWYSGSNGHPASQPSLCGANGVLANDGTINIPLNTPDPTFGLVQQQTLWPSAATTKNVPLIKGKAVVATNPIFISDPREIRLTIDPSASTTEGTISKDMVGMLSFPNNSPEPDGAGYGNGLRNQISKIMTGRLKSYNSSTGEMVFRTSEQLFNNLNLGDTIYFFGGNFNDRKPWYFSPNTNLDSLRRIQAYFWYSEWNFHRIWKNGGNYFGPRGYQTVSQNTIGGMNPGYPNSNDPGGQGLGNVPDFINPNDLDNITFTIS